MSTARIVDGVFAIAKPRSISSAQVVRDLQFAFKPSKLFAPWLQAEKESRESLKKSQQRRRRDKRLNVKIGHGGTLDPLATGVLIIGVGTGTKQLERFLKCTKVYDAVLLFGVATDTYDELGKVLKRGPFAHVTREMVENALATFRGQIMQRPPIFSARRINGKHLYDYAREGTEVPIEIEERPVTVENLEITEWLESGSHQYKWPTEEAVVEKKEVAENVLHLQDATMGSETANSAQREDGAYFSGSGHKRKRPNDDEDDVIALDKPTSRRKDSRHFFMSGALQPSGSDDNESSATQESNLTAPEPELATPQDDLSHPPAVRLRMTVTSGFYVRSLCHDLGKAVGSLGIMSELVRTRQGDFELERNVLAYEDLKNGEESWGPKVESMLDDWQDGLQGRKVTEAKQTDE